jgi:hypothetical protein
MRLTRHGATDRGYGTNGRFRKAWSVGTGDTGVTHVERDYAGRLLFAGTYGVSGSSPRVEHGAVLRLTPDGKPDASFAVNGIFTPLNDDGTGQPVAGIAPTSDGSYVLAVSTCPLNFDPDGDNKCKGTFKTRELDSTGFPNPLWGVGGNGDLPGNFDHIIRMIASENHLYAAFGEVWATLNSPTRFGALRITR